MTNGNYKTYQIIGYSHISFNSLTRLKIFMKEMRWQKRIIWVSTYDFRAMLISLNKKEINVRIKKD
jgi:hypothetical protein